VLDLATIEGARAVRSEDELGSLEVGKRADVILVDGNTPNMRPIHGVDTVVSDLVYSVSDGNVETTIVDGKVLMLNRKMRTLDLHGVISATQERIDKLLRK
jgi:5-methylthioadenosine/S-adenosylhomocysteine deaminase